MTHTSGAASAYDRKPWLRNYPASAPPVLEQRYETLLGAFASAVERAPDRAAVRYFDATLSYREIDRLSDAFAGWLVARGLGPGERVTVALQNVPQFLIATLGIWKAGGVVNPANPMYRRRELVGIFADCMPAVVICHADQQAEVAAAIAETGIKALVLRTSPSAFQTRNDRNVLPDEDDGRDDFLDALGAIDHPAPALLKEGGRDMGVLLYTSGTTGVPKGVMISHRAIAFNAESSALWFDVPEGARLLTIAPLFHITGFIALFAAAVVSAGAVVITYRFTVEACLDAIRENRPHMTVAAITAFIAIMSSAKARPDDFESFRSIYSGGANVPPHVAAQFTERFGKPLMTAFGMTELCAPSHVAPAGLETPVDAATGALSIGIPTSSVEARILDDQGLPVPVGQPGEMMVRGPQVMMGYWGRPEETAANLADGWVRTGDIAIMDEDGWFFLVDRKKDMINAAGFKISPREVEDLLYTCPEVREVAVVGVPDAYRGETVKAVVSLRPGASSTPEDLIAFCRERIAAFKVPRIIEITDDLPKTLSGKIRRDILRAQAGTEA
jgi:long-chain acyl-CoA synthetase